MQFTVRTTGRLVDVRFHSVPTVHDLQSLQRTMRETQRSLGRVVVLATVTRGALDVLDPAARKYFLENWRIAASEIDATAVVIEGEGIAVSVTRAFIRGLGTVLGGPWTVHGDHTSAITLLAKRAGVEPAEWLNAVRAMDESAGSGAR